MDDFLGNGTASAESGSMQLWWSITAYHLEIRATSTLPLNSYRGWGSSDGDGGFRDTTGRNSFIDGDGVYLEWGLNDLDFGGGKCVPCPRKSPFRHLEPTVREGR